MSTGFEPWPINALQDRLRTGRTLFDLCSSRAANGTADVREHLLEDLTRDVIRDHLTVDRLIERAELRETLRLATEAFPTRSRPDIAIQLGDRFHILEVKSSKVNDRRSQCVLGKPFRAYLESRGHVGPEPWEVEQDLIKLGLFAELSGAVESCTFLMVDAYAGGGVRWSDVFSDPDRFRETMRTQFIKDSADRLLARSLVQPIVAPDCEARLIVCEVANRRDQRRPL